MEIKINKEIRAYRETLFFGLSVRQFICSILAVGVAVGLYFSLSQVLDQETVSWCASLARLPWPLPDSFSTTASRWSNSCGHG